MKNVFATLITIGLLAQISFAQDLTKAPNKKNANVDVEKSSGIEVGLLYSNLTDSNTNADVTYQDNGETIQFNESSKGGTHLGTLGINVNYKDKTAFNLFGYYFGAAMMQSMNSSESSIALNIYKTQGGMIFTPINHLSLYTDINVSYFDILGENEISTVQYTPAAGMDFIVEYSVKNISFQVGYQVLGINVKAKNNSDTASNFESKITGFVSGITTQISYMF